MVDPSAIEFVVNAAIAPFKSTEAEIESGSCDVGILPIELSVATPFASPNFNAYEVVEFHLEPLPTLNFNVSVSKPSSPESNIGLFATQFAAVSLLNCILNAIL